MLTKHNNQFKEMRYLHSLLKMLGFNDASGADIYIFGTNHNLQCGTDKYDESSITSFESELQAICTKYKIARIAEEISSDGLAKYSVQSTVAQRLLGSKLTVQALDLSAQERELLSIGDSTALTATKSLNIKFGKPFREDFDELVSSVRERVWVARILSKEEWPVLLICGASHSISLRNICHSLGINSKVLRLDYDP